MVTVAASSGSMTDASSTITFIPGESATGLADSTLSWVLSDTAVRVSGGVFSLQACPCCWDVFCFDPRFRLFPFFPFFGGGSHGDGGGVSRLLTAVTGGSSAVHTSSLGEYEKVYKEPAFSPGYVYRDELQAIQLCACVEGRGSLVPKLHAVV